jgi:hypothetical protein
VRNLRTLNDFRKFRAILNRSINNQSERAFTGGADGE